jgi:uncharacterized membrane protein YebE (DUF533 family)
MSFQDEMQKELEAAQKEFGGEDNFIINRDLFLKHFFDNNTQGSFATTALKEAGNLAGAAGGVAAASALFLGNLGVWGVLIGATTPIGWLAAGAGAGYLGMKFLNKGKDSVESNVYEKTAKYISCPMDQVARGLCQLTMPVAIAAAYSDDNYDSAERVLIIKHFVETWGLNPKAVNELMTQFESMYTDEWDSLELAGTIKKSIEEMTKGAKGIDRKVLQETVCTGIVKLSLQVVESDGVVHKSEKRFIKRLASDLGVPKLVESL